MIATKTAKRNNRSTIAILISKQRKNDNCKLRNIQIQNNLAVFQ